MPFIIKKTVARWYGDVSLSIELMESFVNLVEKQICESIADYRAKQTGDTHQGLGSETWDLNGIFEEYFPNLLRRSALLTLWGFLEHELNSLCSLYQTEKSFTLAATDLSDKGIDRSTNYLEKVAGLLGLKASTEWHDLKALQQIRNLIAHNEGKLLDRNGKPRHEILNAMSTVGFVKGDYELILEEGFLPHAVDFCESYFSLISKSIETRERSSAMRAL